MRMRRKPPALYNRSIVDRGLPDASAIGIDQGHIIARWDDFPDYESFVRVMKKYPPR